MRRRTEGKAAGGEGEETEHLAGNRALTTGRGAWEDMRETKLRERRRRRKGKEIELPHMAPRLASMPKPTPRATRMERWVRVEATMREGRPRRESR